ncbi:MAG: DNA polymerase Y family protein [Sneathiella sp.]
MKRFIVIWLPKWPIDCRERRTTKPKDPFALTSEMNGGVRLYAVNEAAASLGLVPQMKLANARALAPELSIAPATVEQDQEALLSLADWCGRFSPWCATDGGRGVRLEITGCAHLFGGEVEMLAIMTSQFRKMRITAVFGLADSPAVAWAVARFGSKPSVIVPPGEGARYLAAFPIQALRLAEKTLSGLEKVGLRKISDLYDLPRAPLELRFGRQLLQRLDQISGREAEPISPLRPTAPFRTRMTWPDPIGLLTDIEAAAVRLTTELCRQLDGHGKGTRKVELALYRADGQVIRMSVGTSVVTRDAKHMMRLLLEKLPDIDVGFGVDVMICSALQVAPYRGQQTSFNKMTTVSDSTGEMTQGMTQSLGQLVDRLETRLGTPHVLRLIPFESHDPARAYAVVPPMAPPTSLSWPQKQPRPLRLLPVPERMKMIFEGPRAQHYQWRQETGRVAALEGPERISPEWWRLALETRDYFRLQATTGQRFWVYTSYARREEIQARSPDWYMHGFFS